ncbi:MAG: hypothetical protein K2J80_09295 [Oscillospiraceae bacterium]|nr:hypothetical protein [Oscillospiraceae bacterium]
MLKTKCALILCAVLLLLTGCAAKDEDSLADYDDFADYSVTEFPPVEFLSAETEFAEYDGNVEKIYVILTNAIDEDFHFDYWWRLEKEVDGEWKAIRFIKNREFDLLDRSIKRGTITIACVFKEYVKQPLLPGHYRIWVGGDDERVPAEFTIK